MRQTSARLRDQLKDDLRVCAPCDVHPGVRRHGMYMFVMRYVPAACNGLPLDRFIRAVAAEGIPLHRCYASTLSAQVAMQDLLERRPEYVRVLPTPVADRAVEEIVYLPGQRVPAGAPTSTTLPTRFEKSNGTIAQQPSDAIMNIAIVGCGYVAEQYVATLPYHPELRLVGAFDRDADRLEALRAATRSPRRRRSRSCSAIAGVELVLNLTNPRGHIRRESRVPRSGQACLQRKAAGDDHERSAVSRRPGRTARLQLGSAPCSVLERSSADAVACRARGRWPEPVRVVYADVR